MKSLQSLLPRLLVLVLLACSADSAFANGKFFRRLEVADEPGIQAQRAVVAFKDGIETLIVQSDVAGADTSYGWLLPLPAEPTSIEPCQSNSLNALGGIVRPEVAEYPQTFLIFSFVLMLIMLAACLDHLRSKARGKVRTSPVRILLGIVVVLFLASLLLPTLSVSRGLAGGVDVLQTVKAGVYDVAVIKGETGEAVEEWLTSNGFASPPSATTIIEDYISSNWCFLAAKVSTETSGTVTHHPLKVAFPVSQAVYPLKLTGSDGEAIQLDLFVIAERRPVAAGMNTWVSDSFDTDSSYYHRFDDYACEMPPIYKARKKPFARIGIPAVSELMWPGCVVTRLHGRLDATDMGKDLSLTWMAPEPMRATLYSQRSAIGWSAAIAMIVVTLSFAWLTRGAAKKGWSWRVMLQKRLVVAVVLGLLVGGARYAMLEIVPVKTTGRQAIRSIIAASTHRHALQQLSESPPDSPFPEAYRKLVMEERPDETMNESADLDKPGDFTIEATDSGWRLTIIDWPYIPVTIPISADGQPQLATE